MNDILEIKGVSKHYANHRALHDISLKVAKGSIFGLLGPNGAGKTSLLRIINQITAPDTGQVLFDGMPLAPQHIARIGYMPEERGLYRGMKVGEQALYMAQLRDLPRKVARERLKYWFSRLEMEGWWNKRVNELSKGMAQKLQFIVTVLHEPDLLIFDEPFSGFDPINAELIKENILELRKQGASVIFSTHRMESVEQMCDDIALINHSQLLLCGNLKDIQQRYQKGDYLVDFSKSGLAMEMLQGHKGFQKVVAEESDKMQLRFRANHPQGGNELLKELMPHGSILQFQEEIPSVNDIFIECVNEDNAE